MYEILRGVCVVHDGIPQKYRVDITKPVIKRLASLIVQVSPSQRTVAVTVIKHIKQLSSSQFTFATADPIDTD
jgi:hypothetical protein